MSSLMYLTTGARLSEFGGALKYNDPRKKCFALSVTKNCVGDAASPPIS